MSASDIAIIGMAGRFPGAPRLDAFWSAVRQGIDTSVELDDSGADGESEARSSHPAYVRRAFLLEDHDHFDAAFFHVPDSDARLMDPQHRVFLETAWEAFEDAGHVPEDCDKTIGVFAGSGASVYALDILKDTGSGREPDPLRILTLNDKDYLTARVAYLLNLKGPCVSVQAACATSLAAVHLASQSLLGFECDLALAGGVSVRLPQRVGYVFRAGGMLSADGRCRAFDAGATGTAYGSGAGAVILRRLEDATRDRDHVYAVIRGSTMTHDGSLKVGFTAPGLDGQLRAVREALAISHSEPRTIGYVEAHGTGTPLGDPIEVTVLAQAFRERTRDRSFCALGSAKSNFGHLDAAAGVTGLIKAVLAVHHGIVPPSIHVDRPNPQLQLEQSPFYLPRAAHAWPETDGPRRACVNSIGMGGTNVHVVIEQAPPHAPLTAATDGPQLLVLSARSPEALDCAADQLAGALWKNPTSVLADVAFTLQTGRKAHPYRRFTICKSIGEFVAKLERQQPRTQAVDRVPPVLVNCGRGEFPLSLIKDELLREKALPDALASLPRPINSAGDHDPGWAEVLDRLAALWTLGQIWRSWLASPPEFTGEGLGAVAASVLSGRTPIESAVAALRIRRMVEPAPRAVLPGLTVPVTGGWTAGNDLKEALLTALGELWVAGAVLNWAALHTAPRRRVSLPTYPFERKRYWFEDVPAGPGAMPDPEPASEAGLFAPVWRQLPDSKCLPLERRSPAEADWLVFLGPDGVGRDAVALLQERGAQVTVVEGSHGDSRVLESGLGDGDPPSTLIPGVDRLRSHPRRPLRVIHASNASLSQRSHDAWARFTELLDAVQALQSLPNPVSLCVATTGVFDVTGDEALCPDAAVVRGITKVLPQEDPRFDCYLVDLAPSGRHVGTSQLIDLLIAPPPSRELALRGTRLFRQSLERLAVERGDGPGTRLVERGVYAITGGLGQLGFNLALQLAERLAARLILIGRHVDGRSTGARRSHGLAVKRSRSPRTSPWRPHSVARSRSGASAMDESTGTFTAPGSLAGDY